eukprot:gene9889-13302_t
MKVNAYYREENHYIIANVSLSSEEKVLVSCGAFLLDAIPVSVNEILIKQFSIVSNRSQAVVQISDLTASTSYRVYCLISTFSGVVTPFEDVSSNSVLVETLCCKKIEIRLSSKHVYATTTLENFFVITSKALPTKELFVTIHSHSYKPNGKLGLIFPNTIKISNPSSVLSQSISARFDVPSVYFHSVVLGGISADEFEYSFVNGNYTVILNPLNDTLLPPEIVTCSFSNDGSHVLIQFDSSTDRGGYLNVFPCVEFFSFTGVSDAVCQWITSSEVALYNVFSLNLNSSITLIEDSGIRAECVTYLACNNRVSAAEKIVYVDKATAPSIPVVRVVGPSLVSSCSNITISFSSSSGAAGRDWLSITFEVTGPSSALISNHLNSISNGLFTTIPNWLLQSGSSYRVDVKLCNFLGVCGMNGISFTVSKLNYLPYIVVAGNQHRSVTINQPITLYSTLHLSCNNSYFMSQYFYLWTIKSQGFELSLSSTISTSSTFKLPSYSLLAGMQYEIVVTVIPFKFSSLIGLISYSTYVTTSSSSLVAIIAGGNSRSLSIGRNVLLDATPSYDPDKQGVTGVMAGLSYHWSCSQLIPFNWSCPFTVINSSTITQGKLIIMAPYDRGNITGRITVTVSADVRSSQVYVDIEVIDRSSTLITISTSSSSSSNIIVSKKLVIAGTVSSDIPCVAKWSSNDPSLDISKISISPAETMIASSRISVPLYLVIPSYSFQERSSVTFSLSCHHSFVSIMVTTNGSPLPGYFKVSPSAGLELLTSFAYLAGLWSDPDLPLMYQFGFHTPTGLSNTPDTLIVQYKSEISSGSSTLPAGRLNSNYQVTCFVQVYDSLGSFGNKSDQIIVNKVTNIVSILQNLTSTIFRDSNRDVKTLTQGIGVIAASLNNANCSAAPNCSSLHREACSSTENTCGPCQQGFNGKIGDKNEKCFKPFQIRVKGCITDSDCTYGDYCSSDGKCFSRSQSCAMGCKNHGRCSFRDLNTGTFMDQCKEIDVSCSAVCICDEGYSGISCSSRIEDINYKRKIRRILMERLYNLTLSDQLDEDNVVMWSSLLSIVTLIPNQLTWQDLNLIIGTADNVLNSWNELSDTSYDNFLTILRTIDSMSNIISLSSDIDDSYRGIALSNRLKLLNSFTSKVFNQMVPNQNAFDSFYGSYRSSQTYISGVESASLSIPLTVMEQITNKSSTTATFNNIDSIADIQMSIISTTALSFGNISTGLINNPVQLSFTSSIPIGGEIIFEMQNNLEIEYVDSKFNFTTYCNGTDFGLYSYVCPVSFIPIVHNCTNHLGSFISFCPVNVPSCVLLNSSNILDFSNRNCSVIKFDSQSTTCSCTIVNLTGSGNPRGRRWLMDTNEVQDEALSVAAVAEFMTNEATNTFSSSPAIFTAHGVTRVMTVIIMFASFWAVGLILIFICTWRRQLMTKKNINDKAHEERIKKSAHISHSPHAVKEFLVGYVNELFPSVFSKKPFLVRFFAEVNKHHRYLLILSAPAGELGDNSRILTGIQLLVTQTMLMFLLALLYDIQGPSDDGSCKYHLTKTACVARKAVLDQTQSYCTWQAPPFTRINANDDPLPYTCEFKYPVFTFRVVITIAVLVSLMTSLFGKPIDYIFEILSSPTADDKKVRAEPSALQTAGRRVSSAARRVSIAAINLASSASNRIRNRALTIAGSSTRKIPRSTEVAHDIASVSMSLISARSKSTIESSEKRRRETFNQSVRNLYHNDKQCQSDSDDSGDNSDSQSESSNSDESNHSNEQISRPQVTIRGGRIVPNQDDHEFQRLVSEIHFQRRLLKPYERDDFDIRWGMDPKGEFARSDFSLLNLVWKSRKASAEDPRIQRFNHIRNQVSLFGTLILIMQMIGTAPFLLQRMIVRFVQPFVFSGLALAFAAISSSTTGIIAFSLSFVLLLMIIAIRYVLTKNQMHIQTIVPINDRGDNVELSHEKHDLKKDPVHAAEVDDMLHLPSMMTFDYSINTAPKKIHGVVFNDSIDETKSAESLIMNVSEDQATVNSELSDISEGSSQKNKNYFFTTIVNYDNKSHSRPKSSEVNEIIFTTPIISAMADIFPCKQSLIISHSNNQSIESIENDNLSLSITDDEKAVISIVKSVSIDLSNMSSSNSVMHADDGLMTSDQKVNNLKSDKSSSIFDEGGDDYPPSLNDINEQSSKYDVIDTKANNDHRWMRDERDHHNITENRANNNNNDNNNNYNNNSTTRIIVKDELNKEDSDIFGDDINDDNNNYYERVSNVDLSPSEKSSSLISNLSYLDELDEFDDEVTISSII